MDLRVPAAMGAAGVEVEQDFGLGVAVEAQHVDGLLAPGRPDGGVPRERPDGTVHEDVAAAPDGQVDIRERVVRVVV